MYSEEKAVLVAIYQKRLLSLSRAANALHEARDAKWQEGFMAHWDAANEALAACISAQNRLLSHISAHQCDDEMQVHKKVARQPHHASSRLPALS
jgi:hypothetical protein